jgi:hypothetical protein
MTEKEFKRPNRFIMDENINQLPHEKHRTIR